MNMFEFAMEIETEGMKFYAGLVERTPNREAAGILGLLLLEEKRHFEIFEAWKKNIAAPPLERAGVTVKAREAFARLAQGFDRPGIPAIDHGDALVKALSLEKNSISLYGDMLSSVKNEEQKVVLDLIIGQERAHAAVIGQLMEFQRHPHEWLENAEWNHLNEEY
jgi:rubrerythrin